MLRFPERLGFNEIDSVFRLVAVAFPRIELELHRNLVAHLRLQSDHSRN